MALDRRTWANVADEQDRGEAGPGGSGRGVIEEERERDRALVGHRHAGPGSNIGRLESEFKWFKTFSNRFKHWSIRKVLSLAPKNRNKIWF
jgi:hypothetical protein